CVSPPEVLTERNTGMVRLLWMSQRERSKQQTVSRKRTAPRSLVRPHLEVLEGRIAPATRVWDGGGANNQWGTAANWVGDVAPKAGDDLVFPAVALQTSNANTLTLSFASMTVSGSGYSFSGSGVKLTSRLTTLNTTGNTTFDMDVILAGPLTI